MTVITGRSRSLDSRTEHFDKLPRGPFGCRVIRDGDMQQFSAPMSKHDKYIKQFDADGRNNQEINRCNAICMIAQKGLS